MYYVRSALHIDRQPRTIQSAETIATLVSARCMWPSREVLCSPPAPPSSRLRTRFFLRSRQAPKCFHNHHRPANRFFLPTKLSTKRNMKSGNLLSGVFLLCGCPSHVFGWVMPSDSPSLSFATPSTVRTTSARPSSVLFMSQGKSKNTEARTENFLDFINEPMDNMVDASDVTETPELDDLAPLVRCIAGAADKRKAEDIVALRVSKVTAMTSFIVIVSGNSRPQNSAISAAIIDDVAEQFDGLQTKSGGAEGTADSGWMLLDYGDVMVHVMTPRSRLYYDVEGQWREKGGEEMDLGDVLLPNVILNMGEGNEAAELGGGMGGVSEEEDPFWS